jgi:hypothetical protein
MGMSKKNGNSLKYLMYEVLSERRMSQKLDSSTIRFTALDEDCINAILKSGVFTIKESKALNTLFSQTKINVLIESTVSELDRIVENIRKTTNNNILMEGPFANIWGGLKKLGDKAKEALAGGWSKVKAIWGQFKELVTEAASAVKDGLVKVFNAFKATGGDAGKKLVQELIKKYGGMAAGIGVAAADKEKRTGLIQEVKDLVTTNTYVTTTFFTSFVTSPSWEADLIAGNASPSGDVGLDSEEAEEGLEDLADEEGDDSGSEGGDDGGDDTSESIKITSKFIIKERNMLLSNKSVIHELLKLSKRPRNLNEAFDKINAALKNPMLKSIVDWTGKILGYLMAPISALAKQVATMAGPKVVAAYSSLVKGLGGPGSFEFAIISTLVVDLIGKLIGSISPGGIQIATYFIPGFGQILAAVEAVVSAIKTALMVYTFATMLTQFAADMQAELAKSNEVKESNYKPNGKFKIKDGNLIFIK